MDYKKPSTAWLTVNRKCNNNCSWCYAQKAIKEDMDFENAKICIQNLKKLGVRNIVLIGGEPTIYPYIIEMIKNIHDSNIKVSIVSNGRKFSNKNFAKQCIEAGVSGIDISLKALTPQEYVENTRSNGFEECINGYKNLMELGFHPTISYVICNYDVAEIKRLRTLLENRRLDDITIQFVKPVISKIDDKISMSLNDMGRLVSEIYYIFNSSDKHYRLEISFPLCLIDHKILDLLIKEKKILTCCHLQRASGLVINTNFTILPCNHFIDMPYSDVAVGLQKSEMIQEFWNSEMVENLRKKTRYYPSKNCISCQLWNICGGGCFTRWLFESPDKYIKNNSDL